MHVQPDAVPHAVIHEGQRDAGGVGHPARLKQDIFGLFGTGQHLRDRGDQILTNAAADTPVGEIDHIPVALNADNEFGIDVDRPEVVDQYRDPKAVVAGKNAVQKRRLASAQEAREDCQGDAVRAGLLG